MADLVRDRWPQVAALKELLDELDGRRVKIEHTIEHVERVEDSQRRETPALRKAAKHRRKQYEVGL